jgi:hypothetical protein
MQPKPLFVNLLRSPGSDSTESIPPDYVARALIYIDLLRSPGSDSQPGGIDFSELIPGLYNVYKSVSEPDFVNLLRNPGSIPSLAEAIPRDKFLSSLNVYKFGIWRPVRKPEIVILNVYGAQESIPRNEFYEPI